MAKKSVEKKDLNQISGGKIAVKSRIAMFEGLAQPQMNPTGPSPKKIDIGERSISYSEAHSNVANAKNKYGKPINVTGR